MLKNIYQNIPKTFVEELSEEILNGKYLRIERIVSGGHKSPENFWYDQDENEWVILLKGSASILFDGESKATELTEGDYINIPAHKKHKVERTSKKQDTIWLCIFYK
jgi:cupin 2 domain-containing protein